MTLHTFGDSHATAAWEVIKVSDLKLFDEISINQLGPWTMSRFGLGKLRVLDISTSFEESFPPPIHTKYFNVKDGDMVVFSFGEIDCRAHLLIPEEREDYYKRNISFDMVPAEEIIDTLVPSYFEAIKANVEKVGSVYTSVFNIVPTPKKERTTPNPTFPLVGSDASRKRIALYMNQKIKEYCEINGYIFFDIYDKYCDEEGFLEPRLSSEVHIINPIYYIEFLNNLTL